MVAEVGSRVAAAAKAPEYLEAFNTCRLVQFDRNLGVRPMGIEETLRQQTSHASSSQNVYQIFSNLDPKRKLAKGKSVELTCLPLIRQKVWTNLD